MSDPAPKPCDWCRQLPIAKQGEDGHYFECSNLIDCPAWPYTSPLPTPALALAAWNAIEKPAADS